MFYILYL
ncbi:hypothetical protein Zm00014a_025236 [Zea mays]|nr:hypothetical protein Zm00014a_025236 [Zea mays]